MIFTALIACHVIFVNYIVGFKGKVAFYVLCFIGQVILIAG